MRGVPSETHTGQQKGKPPSVNEAESISRSSGVFLENHALKIRGKQNYLKISLRGLCTLEDGYPRYHDIHECAEAVLRDEFYMAISLSFDVSRGWT